MSSILKSFPMAPSRVNSSIFHGEVDSFWIELKMNVLKAEDEMAIIRDISMLTSNDTTAKRHLPTEDRTLHASLRS